MFDIGGSVSCEVSLRIVNMMNAGDLDPTVAVQLLGTQGTKRPLEGSEAGEPAEAGEGNPAELDDLLEQAKSRPKRTFTLINICLFSVCLSEGSG